MLPTGKAAEMQASLQLPGLQDLVTTCTLTALVSSQTAAFARWQQGTLVRLASGDSARCAEPKLHLPVPPHACASAGHKAVWSGTRGKPGGVYLTNLTSSKPSA